MGTDENESSRGDVSGTVDYKTLFFGACALVSLLGGGAFSLWHEGADDLRRVSSDHGQQISDLGNRLYTATARVEALERVGQDREERLRALERQLWKK